LESAYKSLHPTQRRFLLCFEACASITKAARWAKVHRQNHYDWLEGSEEYRKAFATSEPRALRALEDEAVRRAHDGFRKAVYYKGRIVGYTTEYSDTLMNTLLKSNPKFRDRWSGELTGKDGEPLKMTITDARTLLHSAGEDGKL
jgi:hypothetical protein